MPIRETLELLRDPIRLGFALLGTAFLMLVFGFGITTDVNNLTFAALDRDRRPKAAPISRSCEARPISSRSRRSTDYAELERRLRSGEITARDRDPARLRPRHPRGRPA